MICGIYLLFWNEGNSITQHKALAEGLRVAVDLMEDTQEINGDLNGKLIHFSGTATTDSQVYDTTFGVGDQSGDNFLKIRRSVEMYQWVEHERSETTKNTGGSTDTEYTYTYTKEWKGSVVNSAYFKGDAYGHENPEIMQFQTRDFVAENIEVGAFLLSSEIVDMMNWWKPFPKTLSMDSILDESTSSSATLYGDVFYFGSGNPSYPSVGDTRVGFDVVPSQVISVVAKQTGSGLSAYTSKSGGSVLLVEAGYHDEAEMFKHANQSLTTQTWIIRFVGWLIMYIAFRGIMRPLSVCADALPFVGSLLEVGNSIVSLGLATGTTTIVIAIAWVVYRPLFSAILMLILALGSWLAAKQVRGKNQQNHQHPYETPEAQFVVEIPDVGALPNSKFMDDP